MKKNAFTLIELVAVIVLLAIILAIAVPSITGVISNATRVAFESDAKLVLKAVDYKKLEDASFNGTNVNQTNIGNLLGLSDANYSSVKIVNEDNNLIVTIVGKGKWDGLIACGTFQNMSVFTSSRECSSDLIPPVITLLGNNPDSIFINSFYNDAGAIAIDDKDGDITSNIIKISSVNPSVPGSYTMSYIVADTALNQTEVVRTVTVMDNIGPIIAFNPNGNTTYNKDQITNIKVDDIGGIDINSLKYLWSTSITEPSPDLFISSYIDNQDISTPSGVSGSYYLWATATDLTGNTTTVSSNVFNLDNEDPVIIINGNDTVTINKGSVYTDSGATATDNVDTSVVVTSTGSVNPGVVGTYAITYNAIDSSGNIADSVIRTIEVVDVSAPVITLNGNDPVNINVNSIYSDAGATATDDVDGDVTSRIVITGTVNPSVVGTYTITYTVKDTANNTATLTRVVNVIDNIAPTVAFGTNGNSTYAKTRSTTVTVSDNVAVNPSSLKYLWNTLPSVPAEASFTATFTNAGTITSPAGVTGSYYLWILGKDTSGNTTIVRTNVFNLDNIKPIITMNGNASITINAGTPYTDAGATATDNIDGVIAVATSGTVNNNVVGTYTITYNVSDSSGNAATSVIRTVTVVDATLPTVVFGTNGNATYAKSRSTTVTVSDIHTGVNSSSLKFQWTTSTTAPAEATFITTFTNTGTLTSPAGVTGSYYLWILGKDNSGNTTIVRTNVFNLDNTKPIITMNGSTPVTVNKGSTYTDAGATATDNIDGSLTVTATGTVNPSFVGTYIISYNASDSSGNAAITVTRTVNVVDVLAPVITIIGSNPVDIDAGTTYSDAGATALDDVDGNVTNRIVVSSNVNPNLGGTYTVTYTVKDTANNTATLTRTVRVYVTWYTSRTVNSATYYGNYSASSNTTYSCPGGYTASGSGSSTTCTQTTAASSTSATANKSCSDGSTYVSSVDKCRIYTDSRVYSCSSGTLSGTQCITSAAKSCTNGSYSVVGSVCSRTVSCTKCSGQGLTCMNTYCGAGGYENANWSCGSSTCTATMSIYYYCPTGTLSGTNCILGSATESCPGGWTMSAQNNCYQNTVTPTTTYSCSSGTLNGTSCYSCSSGTLSGTNCVSTTSNIPNTTYYCPSGGSLSGTTCLRGYYQCSSGTLSGSSCYGSWSAWTTVVAIPSSTLEVQTEKRLTSY